MNVEEILAGYVKFLNDSGLLQSATINAYRADAQLFLNYLEDNEMPPSNESLKMYESHMKEIYRESSIARKLAGFRVLFRYLIERYPSISLTDLPKIRPLKRLRVPNVKEVLALCKITPPSDDASRFRVHTMILVMVSMGLRVSELQALNMTDIDLENRRLRLFRGKEEVLLDLGEAADALRIYIEEVRGKFPPRDTYPLFVNERGGRLTRQGIWLLLKQYAKHYGVTLVRPQELRYVFWYLQDQKGVKRTEMAQMMGLHPVHLANYYNS